VAGITFSTAGPRIVREYICPDPDDLDACNPYAELQFPDEVYETIREYREERA
jgi:hypothetical protein